MKFLFYFVHYDVWGLAPIDPYNELKYFVLFIEDFSKANRLYLLKSKDEVFDCFYEFLCLIETQFNAKLKIFRSDNGTEFKNRKFSSLFREKCIIHQTTL